VRWHEIGLGFLLVILDGGLCDFRSNNRFLSVKESRGRCLSSSSQYHLTATADEISLIFSPNQTLPSPYKPITLHSLHNFSKTFLGLL